MNISQTDRKKLIFTIILFAVVGFLYLYSTITYPTYADDEGDETISMSVKTEERDARVTDSILSDLTVTIVETLDTAGTWLIKIVTNTFNPSVNTLINLEQGNNFITGIADTWLMKDVGIESSSTIMTIWTFAFQFGLISTTLITMFNGILLLFGQKDYVRDTGLMLLGKYCVTIFILFISKTIMQAFLDTFMSIWNTLVLGSDLSTLKYTSFIPLKLTTTNSGDIVISLLNIPITLLNSAQNFDGMAIKGSAEALFDDLELTLTKLPYIGWAITLLALIAGIYMAYKLIKEFLKLFLEIIERYFVLLFLIAFFPAVASTLASNNSKKIFFSYFRMIYTQAFLLMINTIFMVIFFRILMVNGWTEGFLNFLCGLAFLRICQRIDAYMSQMGFNVVQTGAGFMNSIGGFAGGALTAMSALRGADKSRQNIGKALYDMGNRSNNMRLAKVGDVLRGNIPQMLTGGQAGKNLSQTHVENTSRNTMNSQSGLGSNNITDVSKLSSMDDKLKEAGVSTALTPALENANIHTDDIASIHQLDDEAKTFALMNEDGDTLATIKDTNVIKSENAEEVHAAKKEQREAAINEGPDFSMNSQLSGNASNLADAPKSLSEKDAQKFANRSLEKDFVNNDKAASVGGSVSSNSARTIELLPNSQSQKGNALYSNVNDNAGCYRADARIISLNAKGETITQAATVEFRDLGIDVDAHNINGKGWHTYTHRNNDGSLSSYKVKISTNEKQSDYESSPARQRKEQEENSTRNNSRRRKK